MRSTSRAIATTCGEIGSLGNPPSDVIPNIAKIGIYVCSRLRTVLWRKLDLWTARIWIRVSGEPLVDKAGLLLGAKGTPSATRRAVSISRVVATHCSYRGRNCAAVVLGRE